LLTLCCLYDVLFSGSGSLHHLINGAVSLFEKALAKTVGEVVNYFGFLIGEQFLVVAVWRD
jgi:hypothetical protein